MAEIPKFEERNGKKVPTYKNSEQLKIHNNNLKEAQKKSTLFSSIKKHTIFF